ncbi:MAG: LCP family protein [Candidatus Saccharimonadales bacterium]
MSHRPHNNVDGFVLRRRNTSQSYHNVAPRLEVDKLPVPQQFLREDSLSQDEQDPSIYKRPTSHTIGQVGTLAAQQSVVSNDIEASLQAIEAEENQPKKPRRRINKKAVKRTLVILAIVLLSIGGYFAYKVIFASNSIFQGNIFDVFSGRALQKDAMGRSNILLFGTSEDDPGHDGSELTDSMMVISLDQAKKNAVMFSIPRDLWVEYGQACLAGYQGKINALYECAKQGSSDATGANKLKEVVGSVFGMDIQYYAKVNYAALKDAVNAVGGITVTIDSDNPDGIMDPNFDWQCGATRAQRVAKCPPNGHMVDYANGPVQLDGDHALALARARDATGRGYGLDGGNFSREQYQQKIIVALKDKAVSAGTLANPVAVSGLIDSFGNNITTNFATGEIKTLVELTNNTKSDSIRSISLVKEDKPLVTTGSYSGQSIVRPVAGLTNYSQIQSFIQSQLSGETGTTEEATIEVLNATDLSGVASKKQTELASKGVIVTSIGDAPTTREYALKWFDQTGGSKPQTAKKLSDVLGQGSSGSTLPTGVRSTADFVIIIGEGQ